MDTIEQQIKPLWMQSAAGIYPTAAAAEEGWDRMIAVMRRRQREETLEARRAAAARRIDREQRRARGVTTVVPTCGRCATQHRGEC